MSKSHSDMMYIRYPTFIYYKFDYPGYYILIKLNKVILLDFYYYIDVISICCSLSFILLFFYKDLTHILLDDMHYNKSYFLLFFYILFILKFPFFMYFSPIVYDIRRLAVEYARTCVSGVLSFIPINDLAACCCWRRWSFLPRDSRWADGPHLFCLSNLHQSFIHT